MVEAYPQARHVLIVGDDSSPAAARSEMELASVRVVPTLVRQPSPIDDLRALASIWRIMRALSPDLVVTHQSKAGVLGRLCARQLRIPNVSSLSMANFGPGYPAPLSALFRALERGLRRSTTAYAVVGHDLARRYEEIGVPRHKLRVVRSGVRLPAPEDGPLLPEGLRRDLGIPATRTLIVYLGSLEPRKNVLDLLDVLEGVHRRADDRPFLAIAGEGPLAETLDRSIRHRGLESDAALIGFVEAPLSLIAEADAVVLLSQAEGVSQVLVQAAALDTPFVAYQVDGVVELLELGARGRTISIGDVAGGADALVEILGWPRGATVASIDLTDWTPAAIRRGYQDLFSSVLRLDPTFHPAG
jgi:glycosyltransferase involved in cell wall biosynthesis